VKQDKLNGWFYAEELVRATTAVSNAIKRSPTNWMKVGITVKYIQIRIDQRTGDFILQDGYGQPMINDEIYELYPDLK